ACLPAAFARRLCSLNQGFTALCYRLHHRIGEMHLLFATSIVPDGALASGYEIANAAIIAALQRAGARVTVIGFTWPGKPAADPENTIVLGAVDVRTESASPLQKLAWVVRAVLSGLTFASVKLRVVSDAEV